MPGIYFSWLHPCVALLCFLLLCSSKERRFTKESLFTFVPLSHKVLEVLREYFKEYRPLVYLFEGQSGEAYSTRSAQEVLIAAKARAHITKTGSINCLRHTFATHMIENGTDIHYVQELMGHDSIMTTTRYTHIARKAIGKIQSPIDRLKF